MRSGFQNFFLAKRMGIGLAKHVSRMKYDRGILQRDDQRETMDSLTLVSTKEKAGIRPK